MTAWRIIRLSRITHYIVHDLFIALSSSRAKLIINYCSKFTYSLTVKSKLYIVSNSGLCKILKRIIMVLRMFHNYLIMCFLHYTIIVHAWITLPKCLDILFWYLFYQINFVYVTTEQLTNINFRLHSSLKKTKENTSIL